MYVLSKKDFMDSSHVGRYVTIQLCSGETVSGTLERIGGDVVDIMVESSHMPLSISTEKIETVTVGRKAEECFSRSDLRKFRNIHNQKADQPNLSFVSRFKEEIDAFVEDCPDDFLKEYAQSIDKKPRPENLLSDYMKRLDKLENTCNCNLIKALLLLEMKRYGEAAGYLHGVACESDRGDLLRACFFSRIRNAIGAYHWVTQYLLHCEDGKFCEDNVWWFYLRNSVRFASYDFLSELLKRVAEYKTSIAVESMVYILALNNSSLAAIKLLGQEKETFIPSEMEDMIYSTCSFLSSDTDNYYYRYSRCVNHIIQKEELTFYKDENTIMGYVYEYIPEAENKFGFIVGRDLLSYFFREASVADSVRKAIKENICSLNPGNQEKLVQVVFKRSPEGKRTYTAIDVVS